MADLGGSAANLLHVVAPPSTSTSTRRVSVPVLVRDSNPCGVAPQQQQQQQQQQQVSQQTSRTTPWSSVSCQRWVIRVKLIVFPFLFLLLLIAEELM